MPPKLRKVTLWFFAILALTGILSTLVETQVWGVSTFVRSNIIRVHVSWGVLCCILFGIVIEAHIKKVIKYKGKQYTIKKILGITMALLLTLSILTSFVIRHIKVPSIHYWAVTTHWVIGLVAIIIFTLHFLKSVEKKI